VAFFKDANNFHDRQSGDQIFNCTQSGDKLFNCTQSGDNGPQSGVQNAVLTLTYAAIILSVSATISALTLTDQFGEIHSRASRKQGNLTSFQGGDWAILRHFRARKFTRWIIFHCEPMVTCNCFLITIALIIQGWGACY